APATNGNSIRPTASVGTGWLGLDHQREAPMNGNGGRPRCIRKTGGGSATRSLLALRHDRRCQTFAMPFQYAARLDDTIAALASAPGPAARGIVRVSGPHAPQAATSLFTPAQTSENLARRYS